MAPPLTLMAPITYTFPGWTNEQAGEDFNVAIIGVGTINFGSVDTPWNHTKRLEEKIGRRLRVVAFIDPFTARSEANLKLKRDSFLLPAYKDTGVFKSIEEFAQNVTQKTQPRLIVVGAPPAFRGSDAPGRDLEIQLIKHFPGVPIFMEKPVAVGPVDTARLISDKVQQSGVLCSVGYMLRYLKTVQKLKSIIVENNLTVMATTARYACAYTAIPAVEWWNKSLACGPIVEQATHFCDLSRYFGGEVDLSSVMAHSLEWNEKAGELSKVPVDESKIPPEQRIPRVTSATWKYESGAVGALTHLVSLQGANYSCEIEVHADGYLLKLLDPYVNPILHVRRPGSDLNEVYTFENDDPYLSEFSNLVDVVEKGPGAAEIHSSFMDACKTYAFSWAIREASEKTRKIKA